MAPQTIDANARSGDGGEEPSDPELEGDGERKRDERTSSPTKLTQRSHSCCQRGEAVLETARRFLVKQLIAYLLDNMILDFQGNLTLEMVREFLRDDDSRESRALLSKLVEDRGVSDMMITLADCLQDTIKTGINEEVVRDQIRTYAES